MRAGDFRRETPERRGRPCDEHFEQIDHSEVIEGDFNGSLRHQIKSDVDSEPMTFDFLLFQPRQLPDQLGLTGI